MVGWVIVNGFGFSDFQRNPRFGSKLAKRVVELQRKPTSSVFFLFCSLDLEAPIPHDYRLEIKDMFALTNRRMQPIEISYVDHEQR